MSQPYSREISIQGEVTLPLVQLSSTLNLAVGKEEIRSCVFKKQLIKKLIVYSVNLVCKKELNLMLEISDF